MNSGIYECEVYHERLSPKRHRFSYRLFFLDLDLDELATLSRRLFPFSHNRFNLFSFYDRDHLDLGKEGLRENLRAWLSGEGIDLPDDSRIRLITLPRALGYIFNPVCFYFISNPKGEPLWAVAEVCNTYREVKPWLLGDPAEGGIFRRQVPKHFYVSPFTGLEAEFDFRLLVPGERIEIHIDDVEDGEVTLVSWIRGRRRALTSGRLFWFSVRYPLLTLQVILKIHWQAFRLWLRGLAVVPKASDPELQRDLFNPHRSISGHGNPNPSPTSPDE